MHDIIGDIDRELLSTEMDEVVNRIVLGEVVHDFERELLREAVEALQNPEQSVASELEFLRFFYDAAGNAFGPAESDVYQGIMNDFEAHGERVPEGYREDYLTEETE